MDAFETDVSYGCSRTGGPLLTEVAFVGGCTTGLWVTDEFSRQSVRFTDDVDLIVGVTGTAGWYQFRDRLIDAGFTESPDDVVCRMRLGQLKVDFMPDNKDVLGFTNRWYEQALHNAVSYELRKKLKVKVVSPVYLIATKLEAFKGRSNNDPLSSHDLENILTLIDGRSELNSEIERSPKILSEYISTELRILLNHPDFEYAVQSTARNDTGRRDVLMQRLRFLGEVAD